MHVVESLMSEALTLTSLGVAALTLRALWLLPDWVQKWQGVLAGRRTSRELVQPHLSSTGPAREGSPEGDEPLREDAAPDRLELRSEEDPAA